MHTVSPDNHHDPHCPREAAVSSHSDANSCVQCRGGPGPGPSLSSEPSRLRYTLYPVFGPHISSHLCVSVPGNKNKRPLEFIPTFVVLSNVD